MHPYAYQVRVTLNEGKGKDLCTEVFIVFVAQFALGENKVFCGYEHAK